MNDLVSRLIADHIATAERLSSISGEIHHLAAYAKKALAAGGKLLLVGNGGSAADAQHIATELVVRFEKERPALPAIALTTDTSALTAAANDYGAERMFARQVEALGRPGDLLIAITTSGRSANITAALRTARAMGIATGLLTGRDGGEALALADIAVVVPSEVTARIQEMHILVGHILCAAIEA
jgi:D-sedoheptulose 7-phosphate isomerase